MTIDRALEPSFVWRAKLELIGYISDDGLPKGTATLRFKATVDDRSVFAAGLIHRSSPVSTGNP